MGRSHAVNHEDMENTTAQRGLEDATYSVTVRITLMIAHSFRARCAVQPRKLHGSASSSSGIPQPGARREGIVIEIGGRARLGGDYGRLIPAKPRRSSLRSRPQHDLPKSWPGDLDRVAAALGRGELGTGASAVESIRVTLQSRSGVPPSFGDACSCSAQSSTDARTPTRLCHAGASSRGAAPRAWRVAVNKPRGRLFSLADGRALFVECGVRLASIPDGAPVLVDDSRAA